ncbi:YceI family protein [Tsukamurella soli]|uniref:YceI family protein n=1 Tax=Tsukamurella soli TaxID=644556 RepID=A0ABP8K0D8_9ACTN
MPQSSVEPSSWIIDAVHSSIEFSVRRLIVSKVRGSFESFSGTITVGDDGAAKVTAEVDTGSLTTHNVNRDAHLRSGDFLDVEDYPTATFVSTSVLAAGDQRYTLTGDLTLRGVTKPVTLDVTLLGRNAGMGTEEVIGFEATAQITRQDFGITIDVPLETGDKVVGDVVSLSLDISATREAAR